ncbi:hypothetical protein SORDD16_00002 [Streptococcus oralis]|uniref:Uncharacterized protein n=1 Tax=Streptococcus oralis TaxID=1303 RepID=A0A139PGZ1_STROR|nr:hypothetical protein SORDD16_00002 [Streptococcus oralis]
MMTTRIAIMKEFDRRSLPIESGKITGVSFKKIVENGLTDLSFQGPLDRH